MANNRSDASRMHDADEDWEPVAADDPRALVEPGDYQALCVRAQLRSYPKFHRQSIVLTFQIFDGPHAGTMIERYLSVPADAKIKRGSYNFREWILANGGMKPRRRERMPKKKFVDKLFLVSVETVRTDSHGVEVNATAYSKVSRLLELLTTNETLEGP
jgi:hypothetical protein